MTALAPRLAESLRASTPQSSSLRRGRQGAGMDAPAGRLGHRKITQIIPCSCPALAMQLP